MAREEEEKRAFPDMEGYTQLKSNLADIVSMEMKDPHMKSIQQRLFHIENSQIIPPSQKEKMILVRFFGLSSGAAHAYASLALDKAHLLNCGTNANCTGGNTCVSRGEDTALTWLSIFGTISLQDLYKELMDTIPQKGQAQPEAEPAKEPAKPAPVKKAAAEPKSEPAPTVRLVLM